jgi:hypothetical protein
VVQLQQEALLQITRRHADRIKRLNVRQRLLDIRHRPVAERRNFLE